MAYLSELIKREGGTERASFGDLKIIRVPSSKLDKEDKEMFQLSGKVDVLVMIPTKDTKTKKRAEDKFLTVIGSLLLE